MAATFDDWITKYGDLVGYFHGSIPAVLTSDPEMIKQVFVKDGKTITGRQVFTYVTKPLLLNQVRLTRVFGQDWKELRGLISPTFKGSYMKQAVLIMKDRTKLFAEMIEVASRKQGGVVNMHDHVLRLAMDVAMGVFHGSRTEVQRGDEAACKLLHKCRQCTGMFGESKMVLINSISELPFLFKPLLKYGLSRGVPMDAVLAYFGPLFEQRRQMNGCTLEISNPIDAVATPLTFATYLLAMHQDVQHRLREEVRNAITKDGEITYENICGMEYLGQVISEALRMYPSLHGFVQRACSGMSLEKFDPERFNTENKPKINPNGVLTLRCWPQKLHRVARTTIFHLKQSRNATAVLAAQEAGRHL
ncbi:hypothetical protein MTO96_018292 [Rhipicephalus appendiculatus]